jgi:Ankyrin repeats (3 copies)
LAVLRSEGSNPDILSRYLTYSLTANDLQAVKLILQQSQGPKKIMSKEELYYILGILVKDDNYNKIIEFVLKQIDPTVAAHRGGEIHATLLDETIYYKAVKNAKLLLDNGAKVNISNIDDEGNTPMSKAIIAGDPAMVQLLLEYKPDLKIKPHGLSYVQRAIIHKNDEIKLLLMKAGAPKLNIKETTNLKKLLENGAIKVDPNAIPQFSIDEKSKLYYEGMANFIKAVYGPKNNINFFKEAVTKIKTSIELQIKTSSFDSNRLKTLADIYTIFKSKQSEELMQFVIDIAEQWKLIHILVPFYNTLIIENNSTGKTMIALKYGNLAIEKLQMFAHNKSGIAIPEDVVKLLAHHTYYNLGLVLKHIDRPKAKESFIKAHSYNPGDQDTLSEIFEICLILNDHEEAFTYMNQIADPDYKDLAIINATMESTILSKEDIDILLNKYNFFARFSNGDQLLNSSNNDALHDLYTNIRINKLIANKGYEEAINYCTYFLDHKM